MHYYSLLQRYLVMLLITLTFIPCSYAQETEMSDGFCIVLPADVSVVPWPLARDQLPDAQPGKMYLLNKDNSFIAIKTHSKPIVEKDRDLNKLVSVLAPMIAAQNSTIKSWTRSLLTFLELGLREFTDQEFRMMEPP